MSTSEFFVPGERVRWYERGSGWAHGGWYAERYATVAYDAGKHVMVKPDDDDVLTFDGYASMITDGMLRMPRHHLQPVPPVVTDS